MEQRSARQAHNLKAAGSNPAFATIEVIKLFFMDQIVRHIQKKTFPEQSESVFNFD